MDLLHLPKIVKIGKLVTNCEIIIFMRLSNLSESLIIKQNHLKFNLGVKKFFFQDVVNANN